MIFSFSIFIYNPIFFNHLQFTQESRDCLILIYLLVKYIKRNDLLVIIMDILKAFSLLGDEYPVNIQGTIENPLFKANDIGEILGLTQIRKNLLDYSSEEKVGILIPSKGGMQETTFLTEIGLYKIIMRSRKPIANKFQSWVINIIKEIRLTGMYKLKQENEIDKKLEKHRGELKLHQMLLKSYGRKNIVYICKLKDEEERPGFFIIKIGSTHDVKTRVSHLNTTYDISNAALLIDAFQCENYIQIENILHSHPDVEHLKYTKKIKMDGTVSRETYIVNEELLQHLKNVIQQIQLENACSNEAKIAKYNYKRAVIEFEKEKFQHSTQKEEKAQTLDSDSDVSESENEEEEKEGEGENKIIYPVNYVKIRAPSSNAPKVFQYSPDDLTNYIREFECPAEVERELEGISLGPLKRASLNNTIYKGYRWYFLLNRAGPAPTEPIAETVKNKNKSPDIKFIAMLDVKRTKILAVYSTQKEAVDARNMKCNSFSRAIHQQTLSSGHYWNYFEDCSQEMQEEYLKTNKLPERHSSATGKQIQKLDPSTMKVLSVYNSKREIVKKYQTSYSKLNQLIRDNDNEIYQGFIWRAVE